MDINFQARPMIPFLVTGHKSPSGESGKRDRSSKNTYLKTPDANVTTLEHWRLTEVCLRQTSYRRNWRGREDFWSVLDDPGS